MNSLFCKYPTATTKVLKNVRAPNCLYVAFPLEYPTVNSKSISPAQLTPPANWFSFLVTWLLSVKWHQLLLISSHSGENFGEVHFCSFSYTNLFLSPFTHFSLQAFGFAFHIPLLWQHMGSFDSSSFPLLRCPSCPAQPQFCPVILHEPSPSLLCYRPGF